MRSLICKLFFHKLHVVDENKTYSLQKVKCERCNKFFALHHPTKYFGLWDYEDDKMLSGYPLGVKGAK